MADQRYRTSDISVAAWLHIRGAVLISHEKDKKKTVFIFALSQEEAEKEKMDFVSSECAKFDSAVRKLKKVLYD